MKLTEKLKTQKILDKIQQGDFDENDVDNLFMRLRAYSIGFSVFREISDFVAHNDIRNRGITNASLEGMYLSIKFFLEFNSNNKKLDITKAFPSWIKKLIIYQIDKANEQDLNGRFGVSKERLKIRVEKGFKEDKTRNSVLFNGKLSLLTLQAISFLMSFINSKSAFSQDELIEETIQIIKKNNLEIDVVHFNNQSNFFTLCTLLLLHNTKFSLKDSNECYCQISTEKAFINFNKNSLKNNGDLLFHKESFGNLQISGHITLNNNGKDLVISYPVMTTNLEAEKYCHENLFETKSISDEAPEYLMKQIKLGNNITICPTRQLSN